MQIYEIEIRKKLRKELYHKVIDYAVGRYPFFIVVVRQQLSEASSLYDIIGKLENHLVKNQLAKKWPGTKLLWSKANVLYYRLDLESADIVKKHSSGLYQWQQPLLPEDFCIMRNDSQPWLCNIAHEHLAMFYMTTEEKSDILAAIPELKVCLGREKEPYDYY